MSLSQINEVIGRAGRDDKYKQLLFSGSREAFRGYELTESEKEFLMGIGRDSYASTDRGLISIGNMFRDASDFLFSLTKQR